MAQKASAELEALLYDLTHEPAHTEVAQWDLDARVVRIFDKGSNEQYGMGFLLTGEGYLLTAAHVVEVLLMARADPTFKQEPVVATLGGSVYPLNLEDAALDSFHDIALVRAMDVPNNLRPISLQLAEPRSRHKVYTYYFSEGPNPKLQVSQGSVHTMYLWCATSKGYCREDGFDNGFTMNIPSTDGDSGSPIFTPSGELAGIVSGCFVAHYGYEMMSVEGGKWKPGLTHFYPQETIGAYVHRYDKWPLIQLIDQMLKGRDAPKDATRISA